MKSLGSSKKVLICSHMFILFLWGESPLKHVKFCRCPTQREKATCEFGGLWTWFDRSTESEEETQEAGGWAWSPRASHPGRICHIHSFKIFLLSLRKIKRSRYYTVPLVSYFLFKIWNQLTFFLFFFKSVLVPSTGGKWSKARLWLDGWHGG